MGKVIKFKGKWKGKKPAQTDIKVPTTPEELSNMTLRVRMEHTNILVDDVTNYFLARIRGDGVAIERSGEIANFDVGVVRDAMRGAILRFYGVQYPFHQIPDKIFNDSKKAAANMKEIEDLNPEMKTEIDPEPPQGPMVG